MVISVDAYVAHECCVELFSTMVYHIPSLMYALYVAEGEQNGELDVKVQHK